MHLSLSSLLDGVSFCCAFHARGVVVAASSATAAAVVATAAFLLMPGLSSPASPACLLACDAPLPTTPLPLHIILRNGTTAQRHDTAAGTGRRYDGRVADGEKASPPRHL